MIRTRVPATRLLVAASLGAALLAACGGSGSVSAAGGVPDAPAVAPLQLQPIGVAPRPFGLLTTQALAWSTSSAGTYQVTLRPGGVQAAERVLASGDAVAGQVISVTVAGYELGAGQESTLTFSVRDAAGRFEASTLTLELLPVDELPLGSGLHDDLVHDATRDELLVTNRLGGIVQILDVDTASPAYGAQVALLPPGPDAGPWYVTTTADGARGFNLYRSTMLEYDLQSLEIDNNLFLPGGFAPSGIASTPDSTRVYVGYHHTLLTYRATPAGAPPSIEGTGIVDGLVLGGDVAITGDGRYALYAWFGQAQNGLWIVDVDPQSPDYHTLVSQRFLPFAAVPEVGLPVTHQVAIAPDGLAAFVGGPAGLSKIELSAPDFPLVASRTDVSVTGIAASEAQGELHVLAWEPLGTLRVFSDTLELLGSTQLPPLLVERAAVDEAGGRLFLVAQQQLTAGRVLVVPLR